MNNGFVAFGRRGAWRAIACASLLTLIAGVAVSDTTDTTNTITITNGTDSDSSAASWDTKGSLTYGASGTEVILYDWSSQNSATQSFKSGSNYLDATVYCCRVIFHSPGSPSIIWESAPQSMLEQTTLQADGQWHTVMQSTPDPIQASQSAGTAVIYKIQSGGTSTGLSATQFTLSESA